MSIEPPSSITASAAGTQLAQSAAADVAQARRAGVLTRRAAVGEATDKAAGIAAADGKDMQPNDRDPDGRQPWQLKESGQPATQASEPRAANPRDDRGGQIDLVG